MKQRILILIDGSNFYFKLKDLGFKNLLNFNFKKFAEFLSGRNEITNARYYVGRIKQDGTKRSDRLFNAQQKLIGLLKKSNFQYRLGYLLKNNQIYHEKGVDVQMAVDIMVASYEDSCDKIILVSSDTDLLPAIKSSQQKGKIIEYIGFSHKPSIAMVANCKEARLLTKDEIEQFWK